VKLKQIASSALASAYRVVGRQHRRQSRLPNPHQYHEKEKQNREKEKRTGKRKGEKKGEKDRQVQGMEEKDRQSREMTGIERREHGSNRTVEKSRERGSDK
jgi:hypothetical protein